MRENKTREMLHGNMTPYQVNAGDFRPVLYGQVLVFVGFLLVGWLGLCCVFVFRGQQ